MWTKTYDHSGWKSITSECTNVMTETGLNQVHKITLLVSISCGDISDDKSYDAISAPMARGNLTGGISDAGKPA